MGFFVREGQGMQIDRCEALVHGSGIERMEIFETTDHAVAAFRRTDFGRAQSSMRLRTALPMATSVC
ncbi:hypothetical protein FHW16_004817 [Phyllobacterium myrsinacearum]|uniref:Uncharacterized protein n=1 Tax=Phyllobacterium myrsinacearum TaxID=28101 RepID=A0A839EQK5_9HYPH|nr:hypothetical protein [Phyllobacterium myrsinacearum]